MGLGFFNHVVMGEKTNLLNEALVCILRYSKTSVHPHGPIYGIFEGETKKNRKSSISKVEESHNYIVTGKKSFLFCSKASKF